VKASRDVLGRKWALLVLRNIGLYRTQRFNEMARITPGLTKRGPASGPGAGRPLRRLNEDWEYAVSSWQGLQSARAPSLGRLRAGRGRGQLSCRWVETLAFRTVERPLSERD